MRFALLTTDSLPNLGGVSNYLDGMMRSTSGAVDWLLVSTVPAGSCEDDRLPYRVRRISAATEERGDRPGDRFLPVRKLNTYLLASGNRRNARRLVERIIRDHDPDAVVIACWNRISHWWCQACRDLRMPYLLITYGLEIARPAGKYFSSARVEDVSRASMILAISRYTAGLTRSISYEDIPMEVLNPGICPESMTDVSTGYAAEVRDQLNIRGDFILSLGRLIHRKGFDLAVKAFDRIAGDHPDIKLVIAGDGDHRSEVESAVLESPFSGRILMVGSVSDPQRDALFHECSFFLMPNRPVESDQEGFGIVFLQANYFGKPVIAGNNGGVPDAVEDGETGFLVDSPSVESISNAMEKLLNEPALAGAMGRRGRRRVMERFTWNSIAEEFLRAVSVFSRD